MKLQPESVQSDPRHLHLKLRELTTKGQRNARYWNTISTYYLITTYFVGDKIKAVGADGRHCVWAESNRLFL